MDEALEKRLPKPEELNAMTKESLAAAFAGESQAAEKYMVFAEQAEDEGYPQRRQAVPRHLLRRDAPRAQPLPRDGRRRQHGRQPRRGVRRRELRGRRDVPGLPRDRQAPGQPPGGAQHQLRAAVRGGPQGHVLPTLASRCSPARTSPTRRSTCASPAATRSSATCRTSARTAPLPRSCTRPSELGVARPAARRPCARHTPGPRGRPRHGGAGPVAVTGPAMRRREARAAPRSAGEKMSERRRLAFEEGERSVAAATGHGAGSSLM